MNVENNRRLREALEAELSAISLYEEIRDSTDDEEIKEVFEHIIEEEKHHVVEFYNTLSCKDEGQKEQLAEFHREHSNFRCNSRGKGRGWHNDRNLHALARRGIKTKTNRRRR